MSTIKTAVSAAALLAAPPSARLPIRYSNRQRRFINGLAGGKPIYTLSPADARNVLAGAQKGDVKKLAAQEEDRVIKAGPTGSVKLRIVRPEHAKGTPSFSISMAAAGCWAMPIHMTGWCARSPTAPMPPSSSLTMSARRKRAIEQAYAATKYVAEHAKEFKVDASRLAVAGDSVGDNMAAVVTLLAKERGGPAIDQQVLFYPVTDANFNNGSYNEFADGPWLTKEAMKWFWNAYLPDEAKRKEPTASPLQASLEQLNGLPPALVIVDENDVLRDEGEAYARKLSQAGVRVTSMRYNGTIHDFVLLNAIAETPATRNAIAVANDTLRSALHK